MQRGKTYQGYQLVQPPRHGKQWYCINKLNSVQSLASIHLHSLATGLIIPVSASCRCLRLANQLASVLHSVRTPYYLTDLTIDNAPFRSVQSAFGLGTMLAKGVMTASVLAMQGVRPFMASRKPAAKPRDVC